MIKRFTLGLAVIFASLTLAAQDTSHLRLHIDFANANGRNIPDKDTGSGITAKTVSSAAVEAMGPYSVLNLGNSSGYLDLTRNTGAIIKTLSDFTFSVYYRVDESASLAGNGYFLFSFSQMLNNTDTSGPYIAHRLNVQRMAISTGGYTNEHGMELGTASQQGRWIHFVYRQRGTTGTVYLNGRQAMSLSKMPIPSATFPVAPNYCWLGRAPFANDSYLKQTLLYDVRLYDNAISDSELQRLAYIADELEQEYRYGTPGDASALSAKLDEARAFLSSAGSDYAESAVAELRDAVTLAEVEISRVVLGLMLPDNAMPDEVTWHDGTHGSTFAVDALTSALTASATFRGQTYTYTLTLKDAAFSYYNLLTADDGYTRLDSENQLAEAVARGDYFVIASDDADLLVGLQDQAPMNGNRALFYQTPADPATHLDNVFTLETFEDGYCLRNVDYDGLLLQTEWDAPWNIRTHDQPYPIIWAKWLLHHEGGSWTWENGTYTGNRLGLWFPENGYAAGQEMACNKSGADVARFQLFAIPHDRFHALYIAAHGGSEAATTPVDLTPLIASPDFSGNS